MAKDSGSTTLLKQAEALFTQGGIRGGPRKLLSDGHRDATPPPPPLAPSAKLWNVGCRCKFSLAGHSMTRNAVFSRGASA